MRPRKGSNNTKTDPFPGAGVKPIYKNYLEEFSREGPKTLIREPEEACVNDTYCVTQPFERTGV